MQEFIIPLTYFTAVVKLIVGIAALAMIFIWPRLDATASGLGLRVFRFGGAAFWTGLFLTHIFEFYRLTSLALAENQPTPLPWFVVFYALGGFLKAVGLPIIVISFYRWLSMRIVSPAVGKLVNKMIDEAERELEKHARIAAADLEHEPPDMDAAVGVVPDTRAHTSSRTS